MKLNPEKCTFGVQGEKFLGFMITHIGIEINSNKYKEIPEMRSLMSIKVLHRLVGWITSLSRFMSKSVNKSPTFLLGPQATRTFPMDIAAQEIFKEFKKFLSS